MGVEEVVDLVGKLFFDLLRVLVRVTPQIFIIQNKDFKDYFTD